MNHIPIILTTDLFSSRIPVTLVTRSTLEVVIPEHAVPKLITRSKNKLAQISEVSLIPASHHILVTRDAAIVLNYVFPGNSGLGPMLPCWKIDWRRQERSFKYQAPLSRLRRPRACFKALFWAVTLPLPPHLPHTHGAYHRPPFLSLEHHLTGFVFFV